MVINFEGIFFFNLGTGSIDFFKKVMCNLKRNLNDSSTDLVNLEPNEIPSESEVIIYSRITMKRYSTINVDEGKIIFGNVHGI